MRHRLNIKYLATFLRIVLIKKVGAFSEKSLTVKYVENYLYNFLEG
jgi:hypothetical protein